MREKQRFRKRQSFIFFAKFLKKIDREGQKSLEERKNELN